MQPNRCSVRRLLLCICAVSCLANVVFFALMLFVQPHPGNDPGTHRVPRQWRRGLAAASCSE